MTKLFKIAGFKAAAISAQRQPARLRFDQQAGLELPAFCPRPARQVPPRYLRLGQATNRHRFALSRHQSGLSYRRQTAFLLHRPAGQ